MVIANISEPTTKLTLGPVLIATFDGKSAPLKSALDFANRHHVQITNLVAPPGDATHAGFQEIHVDPKKYEISCDGVLVTTKQTVAMQSRDCPIVTIADTDRMEWVVCHAGRPAISPLPFGSGRFNHGIISKAVGLLLSRGSEPNNLQAYITAGICKKCFKHHQTRDAHLLRPFRDQYGWAFDAEKGWFDIKRVIVSQLTNMRISSKNIHQDGMCTMEHDGLASKRGGDGPDKNNLVLVLPQP